MFRNRQELQSLMVNKLRVTRHAFNLIVKMLLIHAIYIAPPHTHFVHKNML